MSGELLQGFTNTQGQANNSGANLNLLSGFTSAIGKLTQGYGQSQNYSAQQKAENANATIASSNASAVGLENASNIENLNLAQKQQEGRQAAGFGQANIGGPATGTAQIATRQTQINAEMGLLTQQYQGNVKMTGLQNTAALDRYYGSVAGTNASRAMTEGGLSATAALISGYGRYSGSKIPTSSNNDAQFSQLMSSPDLTLNDAPTQY